ncbi:hypothetical protein NC796_06780 [Aliifodinibius sp. S!AR15-10]|uniref:hypothetical protein n=1 Tax=Aliifodinibius sp. S!AR15-10 TaxID=2950437 RepID=UPI00286130AF|nr:hypothetical protein [Aliifodinibius sp. S!AR15-10]MDR8390833.1 hypothetical protein [Aliifodinibius sp. S!AR15-10]
MRKLKSIALTSATLVLLLMAGCSKSDDQKDFENEAYSAPANYTAMNANGQPAVSNQTDPDDWRISPMYRGLVEVETEAYPNPVFINSTFRIFIGINYITNLSRIEAFVFQTGFNQDGTGAIDTIEESQISEGTIPALIISPSSFPQNKLDNLYRVILFDQSGNVITYGDVKVNE